MKIRRSHLILCSAIVLPLLAVGCGGGDKKSSRRGSSARSGGAAAFKVDPATAGSISGKVMFENGNKPIKLNMGADPYCDDQHPGGAYARSIVVNDNETLRWVFVYVKSGLEGKSFATPDGAVHLNQNGCQYEPHVFGIQTEQALNIKNSDQTLHNIHAMPKNNPEFNMAQPMAGMESEKSFPNMEVMVPIKCDVHPWMQTYAGVLEHPYYAVTDETGAFNIGNLPPGNYVLEAWHEKFGAQTLNVNVGASAAVTANFTYASN